MNKNKEVIKTLLLKEISDEYFYQLQNNQDMKYYNELVDAYKSIIKNEDTYQKYLSHIELVDAISLKK